MKLKEKEEQTLSAMFIIGFGSEDIIEKNCKESGLTPDWDLINKDIYQIEKNMIGVLKSLFGNARDEGHSDDDLIGIVYLNGNKIVDELYSATDKYYDFKSNKLMLDNIQLNYTREILKNCSDFGSLVDANLSIWIENPSALYLKELSNYL